MPLLAAGASSFFSSPALPPIIGIVGLAVGAWATNLTARRKASGRIDTSEAAVLWREAQAMRQELRESNERLQAKVVKLEATIAELEAELRRPRRNPAKQ